MTRKTDRPGLSRSALMRRGWTHRMILDLLPGGPDATAVNPKFPGGVPMQIFSLARIEAVEASQAYLDAMAASVPTLNLPAITHAALTASSAERARLILARISAPCARHTYGFGAALRAAR